MDENIDNLNKNMDTIKDLLLSLHTMVDETNKKVELLDEKIDKLTIQMNRDIISECKKMGSHIDFVESVYDSVKQPLSYACKKIFSVMDSNQEQHRLHTSIEEHSP